MKIEKMKQCRWFLFLVLLALWPCRSQADTGPLRFAWLSDTHVGSPTGAADLRASVKDINSLTGLSFVIISGDVTEFGSHEQFVLAKSILDGLRLPCHVIPGNHDCKWSESGATEFGRIWGSDRFVFDAGGICFIAMHQGPVMKMGDGHFSAQDVRWLEATLGDLPKGQPIIFVTHYPIRDEIDNWYVVLDDLKKYNTQAILVGHGHRNEKMNFEGVPAVMGRSNLGLVPNPPGYTLVEIEHGVMTIAERNPGRGTSPPWDTIPLQKHDYAAMTNHWPRPDFSVNSKYPGVCEQWQFDARWTMAASPAVAGGRVFVGDGAGKMRALSLKNGAPDWEFTAGGPIYSTPVVAGHRVVFASTDGSIYALKTSNGKKLWQFATAKPVVASPCVTNNTVYIGASDGTFRALNLANGKVIWEYPSVGGFVETRPLAANGEIIFGAWDDYLYSLNATNGQLLWKWRGKRQGSLGVMYSPAAFWPVAAERKLFVVAPDRQMTALNLATGHEIWRTNGWQVRESIGLAQDRSRFYVRTMTNTSILAFATAADHPEKLWELDTGISYDINAAMLVEKEGVLYYGTKNGLLLAIDPRSGTLLWEHKLGVTGLNTVVPIDELDEVLVCDWDGKVTRVGPKQH
jgi:outer membrane protein assembly factor BamB/predicted phosphodiesterase